MVDQSRMSKCDNKVYTKGNIAHVFTDGRYTNTRRDIHSRNANIIFGQRLTAGNPEKYRHTVYFGGLCTAVGDFVSDEETIESQLQSMINLENDMWRVVNHGASGSEMIGIRNSGVNDLYLLMDANLRKGDIVVFISEACVFVRNSCVYQGNHIQLKDIFNQPKYKKLKCFVDDRYAHFNKEGNRAVAEYLYNAISRSYKKRLSRGSGSAPS